MYKVRVFGAEWCGPCQDVKDLLDNLNVYYTFVDVDKNYKDERIISFNAIPVIDFIDENDNIVKTHIGAISKNHLKKILDGNLR